MSEMVSIVRAIVQCAVLPEFEGLRQVFRAQKIEHGGHRSSFVSEDQRVVCVLGGMGFERAKESAYWALKKWKTQSFFDFGIAGGLAPMVSVGDIVIADYVYFSNQTKAELNFVLPLKDFPEFEMRNGARVFKGGIREVKEVILDTEHRKQIYEETKGSKKVGALAVTWETGALYQISLSLKLNYQSVRMISDVKEEDLTALRPLEGIPAEFLPSILGKKIRRDIAAMSALDWQQLGLPPKNK